MLYMPPASIGWLQIFLIQAVSTVLTILTLQTGLGSCFLDASFCRSSISCSFNKIISSCCNLRDGLIFGWAACLGPWYTVYGLLGFAQIDAERLMKGQAFWNIILISSQMRLDEQGQFRFRSLNSFLKSSISRSFSASLSCINMAKEQIAPYTWICQTWPWWSEVCDK